MKPDYEFEHMGVQINIYQDQDAQSPSEREGGTALFLISGHRSFYVPEPGEKRLPDWETLKNTYEDSHWIIPVEAYIHSGVRLSLSGCGNYPDRGWDVSQVGGVFASKKEWPTEEEATKAAKCLIGEWNMLLSGDVWGYVVAEGTPFEESCWGYYGLDSCKDEAKSIAEHVAKQMQEEAEEKHRAACCDITTE